MSPDQWLHENYLKEIFSGNFEHLARLIQDLDLTPRCKVITIGGTNGKGQTARSLDFFLRSAGKKTALITSPHLVAVNERFVFNGEIIADAELLECFESLHCEMAKRVSYFEFLFLCFLKLAKQKPLDYLILEVGLGGRLDAINSVEPSIVALTSISRDHQDLLGNSYKQIFEEKAGLLRPNLTVFTSFGLSYLNQLMLKKQKKLQLNWKRTGEKSLSFSQSNKLLAKKIAEYILNQKLNLNCPEFAMRYSALYGQAVIDGFPSHNPEGLRKLFQFLNSSHYNEYDTLLLSFSKRPWSDLVAMMKIITAQFRPEQIVFYQYEHFKSLPLGEVKKLKEKFEFQLRDKNSFSKNELKGKVLLTGSNYFLGHFIDKYLSRA